MMQLWQIALLVIGAYLLGAIPFGLIVAAMKGVDIRRHGSGNLGATNVGRVLGRKWGVLVFLLDCGKGMTATLVANALLATAWQGSADTRLTDVVLLAVGVCCVLGNIAPVYLRFKGGKGVATSLGVILGIFPYLTWPGLVALTVWAVVVKLSGYVSLGSIVAACCLPIAFLLLSLLSDWTVAEHYPLMCLTIAMWLLVMIRHRSNIRRLLAGTENRISDGRR